MILPWNLRSQIEVSPEDLTDVQAEEGVESGDSETDEKREE